MFSTTTFQDGFLQSFARLSVDSRIQTIASEGDPRANKHPTAPIGQRVPSKNTKNFPLLNGTASDPEHYTTSSFSSTYAYVLLNGYNGRFQLEQLPKELREMIWEARMRADGYFKRSFDIRAHRRCSDNPKSSRFPPQACLVSKGFRDETVGVFMRNSTFTICSILENIFLRKPRRGQRRGQRRCIARARTCLRQLRLLP